MITFDEYYNDFVKIQSSGFGAKGHREVLEGLWNKARQGMIPAENAVVIPPVSEWPEGANGISILFVSEDHVKIGCAVWESFPGESEEALIKFIPRPKPAWTPKIGEAIFFRTYNSGKAVGEFRGEHETFDTCWKVMNTDGNMVLPAKCDCKPFRHDSIGKPWDEIPGGRE